MKKNQLIKLHIPAPCHQDWEAMKRKTDGRHCQHCQKTVVDFSAMTDSHVYLFFSQNKDTHCGRFLNTQLQRDIVPLQTPSARVSRCNAFAAVVTLVALNTVQVFGQKNNAQKQVITQVENSNKKQPKQKVTITGTLTSEDGMLLEKAKVVFDSITTITDKDGRFSFEITNDNTDFHNLYFSYEGMISEVRSYHPAMGSTRFDVRLSTPHPERYYGHTMGALMPQTIDLPTLKLKKLQIKLTPIDEALLTLISKDIRANPGVLIQITAYAKSSYEIKIAKKRFECIETFLEKNGGVSTERFKRKIENITSVDVIDFISIDPSEEK